MSAQGPALKKAMALVLLARFTKDSAKIWDLHCPEKLDYLAPLTIAMRRFYVGLPKNADMFNQLADLCENATWLEERCEEHFDGDWISSDSPLFYKPAVTSALAMCAQRLGPTESIEWWTCPRTR